RSASEKSSGRVERARMRPPPKQRGERSLGGRRGRENSLPSYFEGIVSVFRPNLLGTRLASRRELGRVRVPPRPLTARPPLDDRRCRRERVRDRRRRRGGIPGPFLSRGHGDPPPALASRRGLRQADGQDALLVSRRHLVRVHLAG